MSVGKKKVIIASVYLLLTAAALIFSSLAFFDRSAAWFAQNANTDSDGLSATVKAEDAVSLAGISIYKVDENNNTATVYENPRQQDLPGLLTMNQYDSVFEEKRGHTPIIIKTTLENFKAEDRPAELTVTVSLKESTAYTVTSGEKQVLQPYISNFIRVSCSTDPALSPAGKTPAEYYPYARDWFIGNAAPAEPPKAVSKAFVSYTGSGDDTVLNGKAAALVFSLTKPAGAETLDVYLMLSYDDDLIARYVSDKGLVVGSAGEQESHFAWGADIEFAKDIARISFEEVTVAAE